MLCLHHFYPAGTGAAGFCLDHSTDHLGTPRKMTDQSGALAWDRVAMPFGETVSLTGTDTNPLRFPGQYFDTETGFHYNYFRDYDPSVGRYLQSDPIGLAGGLNTYSYVLGNPVNLVDPTGESPAILAPIIACLVNPACASGGAAVVGGAIYCLLAPDLCKVPNLSSTDFCPLPSDFFDNILLNEGNGPDASVEPSIDDPDSLAGLSPDEVRGLIPDDFIKEPSRSGGGERYRDPRKTGEQIRIMPGNENSSNPVKRGPYVRISRGGVKSPPIPLKGNPSAN